MQTTCISDGSLVADQIERLAELEAAEHDLPRQWFVHCLGVVFESLLTFSTEVTQQSKARHKEDFLNAFSPFIADAASVTYKGAPADVQAKLRRVVDVWRERSIFDKEVLQDLENRLAGRYRDVETC